MTVPKLLLLAMALWMTAASFAAAVGENTRVEVEAPCAEHEAEDNDLFLTPAEVPFAPVILLPVGNHSPCALDGAIAELDSPPPKPSSH